MIKEREMQQRIFHETIFAFRICVWAVEEMVSFDDCSSLFSTEDGARWIIYKVSAARPAAHRLRPSTWSGVNRERFLKRKKPYIYMLDAKGF